jgi:hypothetical protein
VSDFMSSVENDAEDAITGGQLEKAYLLILPPSSPAGGLLAAGLGAAGIAGEDAAGSMGSSSSGTMSTAEDSLSGSVGGRVTFAFNPQEYTISKSASWNRFKQPGSAQTSIPTFQGSGPRQMSLEIFLDATYSTNGSVQDDVDLLFTTLKPTMLSRILGKPSPPFVMFGWGKQMGFMSYMESITAQFTLFRPDGTPIRATCSLSMQEIPMSLPSQNPTSGGAARRTRTTVSGDTLQSIAYREYGKPTMWRALAEVNGIEDPTRIPVGTTLLIPPVAEAAEVS